MDKTMEAAKRLVALVDLLAAKVARMKTLPVDPHAAFVEGFRSGFDHGIEAQQALQDPKRPISAQD